MNITSPFLYLIELILYVIMAYLLCTVIHYIYVRGASSYINIGPLLLLPLLIKYILDLSTYDEISSIIYTGIYIYIYETCICISMILFIISLPLTTLQMYYRIEICDMFINNSKKINSIDINQLILFIYCIIIGSIYIYIYILIRDLHIPELVILKYAPVRMQSIYYCLSILTTLRTIYVLERRKISIMEFISIYIPMLHKIAIFIYQFSPVMSTILSMYIFKVIIFDILIPFPPATLVMFTVLFIVLLDRIYMYIYNDYVYIKYRMPYIHVCVLLFIIKICIVLLIYTLSAL